MQLLFSFVQYPSNEIKPIKNVWMMLPSQQRNEAIAVLARLLEKAATNAPNVFPRKGKNND